ncbi:hypothetical protein E2C01_008881 [Portunus trituberculatus]|uniref:Integrin beta epidermal growth factor-like domain-containing protein n=1 Tax=Portunus trituberculatus TaxID=210409 RepID=A0A5B7D368_PORTR|nr:hypothetical protein [Portunus trituberculatus]
MGKGVAMRLTAAALVLVCGLTRAMPESDIPGCSASAYPVNCYAGNNSGAACSGRGTCVCGQCVCNERESHNEM